MNSPLIHWFTKSPMCDVLGFCYTIWTTYRKLLLSDNDLSCLSYCISCHCRQGGRAPSVEVRHNRLIPPHEDTKYIVFETKLLDLFKLCRDCRSGNVCISKRLMGTLLIITVECYSCTSTNKWESQPFYQSRPAGNLLLSAATLFAGGSWTMMRRILSHLRLVCIADQTFYTIQRDILQPAIECRWSEEQQRVVGQLQSTGTPLVIASDGRADSPGHSAKFGVYTGLEATLNKIVDLELVQVLCLFIHYWFY